MISSAQGWPIWQGTFLPFGYEYNPQLTANHYKFAGYEHDDESGLENANDRQYGSQWARFTSPDPVSGSITNPQTLNKYVYSINSPLKYADPSGANAVNEFQLGGEGSTSWSDFGNPGGGGGVDDWGSGWEGGDLGPTTWDSNLISPGWGYAASSDIQQAAGAYVASVNYTNEEISINNGDVLQRGPGGTYYNPDMAGAAAAELAFANGAANNSAGATDNHEYASNVYQTDKGTYGYTSLQRGPECAQGCKWIPSFSTPVNTSLVGSAHNHPAGGFGDTSFSVADIDTFTSNRIDGYLGTSPGDRVVKFDFSLNGPFLQSNGKPPICVLTGASKVDIPTCN